MSRARTPTPFAASLAVGLLLLGACEKGGESAKAGSRPAERGPEFFAAALAGLDGVQDLVRQEVLATCDKWHHPDDPACDAEQVRRDQLECWIDKGAPLQKYVEARQWRPRQRAQRLLLEVNVCMEQRGWRKLVPGRDF